jgi:hypothetical protein
MWRKNSTNRSRENIRRKTHGETEFEFAKKLK